MYLWTALTVVGGLITIAAFLTSSSGELLELMVGTVVLAAFFGIDGAVIWALYLAYQLSVEAREERLIIRSWLRIGRLGTAREIDLAQARRALILRPYVVEFEIPGATTRVWSGYRTVRDRDRFGTMWWFDEDYQAFRALLLQHEIPTEQRDHAGLLSWVTSH